MYHILNLVFPTCVISIDEFLITGLQDKNNNINFE
jgi:hypothetical protein